MKKIDHPQVDISVDCFGYWTWVITPEGGAYGETLIQSHKAYLSYDAAVADLRKTCRGVVKAWGEINESS